ncbi:unnamed protein product [Cyprideis torosa]|uniref:Uncharacterized protein n=1 Tax=Cyprideis torosa TaxID=163714 RepID=A0A7R8ZPD1_9CRUS|nr:unnamed protein product [Cyprideis torosa]CAG0889585.1 unnamed protein product [Cyprideis torosa]
MEAKDILEKKGHTLIEFEFEEFGAICRFGCRLCSANGMAVMREALRNGELLDAQMRGLYLMSKVPRWISKKLLAPLIDRQVPYLANILESVITLDEATYFDDKLRELFLIFCDKWHAAHLDAILSPPFPVPATNEDFAVQNPQFIPYTGFANAFNLPAGIIPITRGTKEDEEKLKDYPRRNISEYKIRKAVEGSIGLPLGCSVMSLPYQDETVLRVMRDLQAGSQFR